QLPAPCAVRTAPAPLQLRPARARSAGRGKSWVISDSEAGVSSAAPTPCTARAAISMPPEVARPAASDASVNTVSPARNTRRAPSTSASRPPASMSPAKTRMYELTIHSSPARVSSSSRWIVGKATLPTLLSRYVMNAPSVTAPSAYHFRSIVLPLYAVLVRRIGKPLRRIVVNRDGETDRGPDRRARPGDRRHRRARRGDHQAPRHRPGRHPDGALLALQEQGTPAR